MPVCISYPKSGRTWLRCILRDLGIDIDYTHGDAAPRGARFGLHASKVRAPSVGDTPVVFLHRDPRDATVSFFYQMAFRHRLSPGRKAMLGLQRRLPPRSLPVFVRDARFGLAKAIAFNLACVEGLSGLRLCYEDMQVATADEVTRLVTFLGLEPDAERIEAAVAANSFHRMREREASGREDEDWLRPGDPDNPDSFKVRRGKVGSWRDELDPETQAFAAEMLARSGYFEAMAAPSPRWSDRPQQVASSGASPVEATLPLS